VEPTFFLVDTGADTSALENRARHAEALFNGIDDAVFVHDLEGHILDANPAACRRLGYTREEMLRLTIRDVDDPEFAVDFGQRLQEQLQKGHLSCEGRHITKDGRIIPVDINTSVIEIEGKLAVLAVMRDITGRKTAEQRLAAQFAVTRGLTESATLREATPKILQGVCANTGWDIGALWNVNPSTNQLRCFHVWQGPGAAAAEFEALTRQLAFVPGEGLPGRVWATEAPVWVADLRAEANLPRAEVAAREGVHAACVVPIRGINVVIGVLEFFARSPRSLDNDLLSMLTVLGSQIGQFIERRRAEEDRDRFFTLSLDMLCIAGFDGYFKRLNPAWERTLGFTLDELLAEPFLNFIHPDDREATLAEVQRESTGAETVAFTNRYRCKDGSYKWLHWKATPFLRQQVMYAAARDITEQKRTEQEVQRINTFLDSIIENIPSMIFVKDAANLRFERINRAAERLLGLRRHDCIGKNDYDFFPKEQADFFVEKDREVLSGKQFIDITEEEIKTSEGRRFIHTRKMPILDDQGNPRYLLGISEDITEHKVLEATRRQYAEAREAYARELEAKHQALSESERRYRQLTEAAPDAVVVADQRGHILLFNPAAERTFGYSHAEVVGRSLTVLMPVEFQARHEQGFQRYLQTREPHVVGRTVELRGRRKDGAEFPLELSLSALDLGGEMQFLGMVRDLTERNRMRAMVTQAEKLASIGLLSAGVAHEINNPLAYVANNMAVLDRDVKGLMGVLAVYEGARDRLATVDAQAVAQVRALSEELDLDYVRVNLDRVLARTREGVQRVTKIVQDLRGLARTAPPQLEEAHIPDLVDMSLEMIRGRLRRQGIAVELDYGPTPKVRCVATQISQVLLNLLVNAMQAIESKGKSPDARIRVATRRLDHELLIEVADNGCGIADKDLSNLFDPFFTTKPVGEGTGLGLSICHGIVSGHGGRIEVDSQPGEGSRFRVFLPLNPQRGRV
jgi:PAS domain S-box-containing protein